MFKCAQMKQAFNPKECFRVCIAQYVFGASSRKPTILWSSQKCKGRAPRNPEVQWEGRCHRIRISSKLCSSRGSPFLPTSDSTFPRLSSSFPHVRIGTTPALLWLRLIYVAGKKILEADPRWQVRL